MTKKITKTKPKRSLKALFRTVTCKHCSHSQRIGMDTDRWSCEDCKTAYDRSDAQA